MRTKWDILQERYQKAQEEANRILRELNWMDRTAFGSACGGCGKWLYSEADFAKHFVIPDERFLNIGECPDRV